jgi:hypothetical protein
MITLLIHGIAGVFGFVLFYRYDSFFRIARLEIPDCTCRNFFKKLIAMNPMFLSFLTAAISVFLHIWLVCGTLINSLALDASIKDSLPLSALSLIFIALHYRANLTMRGIACGKKLS